MTAPARSGEAVQLPDGWPLVEPAPVDGCGRCAELAAGRAVARAAGDLSAVSDANVLIRRHPAH